MTKTDTRLPAPAVAARQMAPGVAVRVGWEDVYWPNSRTIKLAPDTFIGRDPQCALRALHEAGHAVQHMRNTRLWRLRNATEAFRAAWALLWIASLASFFVVAWLGWTFFALGCLVTAANGICIVACEREASEFALEWLEKKVGQTPQELRDARAYLASLRRGYWRTVFGGGF